MYILTVVYIKFSILIVLMSIVWCFSNKILTSKSHCFLTNLLTFYTYTTLSIQTRLAHFISLSISCHKIYVVCIVVFTKNIISLFFYNVRVFDYISSVWLPSTATHQILFSSFFAVPVIHDLEVYNI